ncbi:hypothetical protein [Kitasatospora sp. NPDC018619]
MPTPVPVRTRPDTPAPLPTRAAPRGGPARRAEALGALRAVRQTAGAAR